MEQPLETAHIQQLLDAMRLYGPSVSIFLVPGLAASGGGDVFERPGCCRDQTDIGAFFDRLRDVLDILRPGPTGVDVLVYTPEEFAAMSGTATRSPK